MWWQYCTICAVSVVVVALLALSLVLVLQH